MEVSKESIKDALIEKLKQRDKDMMEYIDKGSELRFVHYLQRNGLISLERPVDIKYHYMKWLSEIVPDNSVTEEILYTYTHLKEEYDKLKADYDKLKSNYNIKHLRRG